MRAIPLVTLLLAGLVLSGPARADDATGFYLGGSIGQTNITDLDEGCDAITGLGGTVTDCDDKDTAFKVFAGYQFNQYFATELGYADLGAGNIGFSGPGGTGNVEFAANAIFLDAVAMLPVFENFSILGRIGAARWDLDAEVSAGGLPIASESEDGFGFSYGAGLQYMFGRNFGIRAEYQVFDSIGDEDTTGESDVHMYSIGIVFKF